METSGATTTSNAPAVNLTTSPATPISGFQPSSNTGAPNSPITTSLSPSNSSTTPASEATVLSTEQGSNDVNKSQATLSAIAPSIMNPATKPTYPVGSIINQGNGQMKVTGTNADGSPILTPVSSGTSPTTTPTSSSTSTGSSSSSSNNSSGSSSSSNSTATYNGTITFLNPNTNQQQTVNASDITPAMQSTLESQGFYSVASTGTTPSWFVTGTTDEATAAAAAAKSQATVTSLASQLSGMSAQVSATEAASIATINTQYANLIAQMTKENAAQLAATQTTGFRMGMQYSGGTGGPFGGIITNEITAGQQRIATLVNEQQQAVIAAQQAAQTQNWKIYDEQVTAANTANAAMQDALKTQQANVAAANTKLQDQITSANLSNAVATEMKSGITDPAQILADLNAQGLNASASDVSSALTALQPTDATAISSIAQEAAKNGAPQSTIDAISKATDTNGAISAAGDYLQEGTGDVADYLQYKRDALAAGQIPEDFQTYDTASKQAASALAVQQASQIAYATAAAKAAADVASGTLSSNGQTVVSGADNDLNKGPVGTQMQQTAEQYAVISSIPANTSDPVQQNQLLLALAQLEVPGAKTVRGVLSVNTPASLNSGVYNLMKKAQDTLDNKGTLSADTIASIQSAAKGIYDDQSEAYNNLYNETVQTTNSRLGITNADDYITNLSSIGTGSTSASLQANGQNAQATINNYVTANPSMVGQVTALYNTPGATDASVLAYMQLHPETFPTQ